MCDPWHPGQICQLASDHHGLLIIPIHWLASSLCLLSTSKLVCGGRAGEIIWLPSHHPGGCCTLVVVWGDPPHNVKRFECLEKRYINVTNYLLFYYFSFKQVKQHIQKYLENLENKLLNQEDRTELYRLFVNCFQVCHNQVSQVSLHHIFTY